MLLLAWSPHLLPLVPEVGFLTAALHAAAPAVNLLLPLAVLTAALRRRRRTTALMALSAIVWWIQHPLWLIPDPADGHTVRLATANLRYGNPAVDDIFDALLAADPDAVALQELTPAHAAALAAHPLATALPHCILAPAEGGFGVGLCSRTPIADAAIADWGATPVARGRLSTPAGPLTVVAVHAMPPFSALRVRQRGAQLATIGTLRDPRAPTVVLGDLNTTPDSPAWHTVTDAGFRTAAKACGMPRRPTWPVPIPVARIDHVLIDIGLGCAALTHQHVPGSDHAVVIADVALAPLATGGLPR
ncbi:MAG: vancomycin resistance protein VanJ [Myxococcota bacterium]|jgi:vancomycin resistance protein VanJ